MLATNQFEMQRLLSNSQQQSQTHFGFCYSTQIKNMVASNSQQQSQKRQT